MPSAISNPNTILNDITATTNTLNQYTVYDSALPTYDANGNLTAMGSSTYSYDARSLLVAAEGPPEANPGPMTNILNITRDTRRRITRLQHNAQITYRIYDNWNLIAEYAPNGTLIKEHIHGTRIDEILLTLPANGPGTYHHHDALGNVVALTNAASCAVLETYTYDAFGKRTVYNATGLQIPDTAYANTNGYTGREHLPISGLMDYRNRSYSTTLGRFLQVDPIGFDAGDVNLYRYVGNRVAELTDPLGLISSVHSATGVAAMKAIAESGAFTGGFIYIASEAVKPEPDDGNREREARKRGKSDPVILQDVNPGREPDGKCRPCPEPPPPWKAPGNEHGSESGCHWHWIEYHQNQLTCKCYAKRMSGKNPPK